MKGTYINIYYLWPLIENNLQEKIALFYLFLFAYISLLRLKDLDLASSECWNAGEEFGGRVCQKLHGKGFHLYPK